MSTVTEKQSLAAELLSGFEAQLPSLPGEAALRRHAAEILISKGIPTRKTEDYKYINPEAVLKKGFGFRNETQREITAHDIAEMVVAPGAHLVVLINGKYSAALSKLRDLPEGVTIADMSDAIVSNETAREHYAQYAKAESDPFVAMNTAMNAGGVFVHVAKNKHTSMPVHVLNITSNETASIFQPRNLFVFDRGARAEIIETYESIGPVKSFINCVTEVVLQDYAQVDHYRLQVESEAAHQINNCQAQVPASALYNNYTFTFSGAYVRNNTNIVMAKPSAEAHLYGLYLLGGSQVCDNHTIVDHSVPNCFSNELYKGVMDGKSTAVFNGKIFVRKDAQKTNAYQSNKNVLLSDDASINTKPQLEIYADDVKCSHGTSTGRLDQQALFYLRARGIGEESARRLLIRAFADEVTDKIKIDALAAYVGNRIDHILG